MTPRKPKPRKPAPRKPKPRKTAGFALATRVADIEGSLDVVMDTIFPVLTKGIDDILRRLEAIETRSRYRDASHDEPVSNGSEAIGHFTLTELERSWWRRFLDHMGAA
jgi:hypothetical protein